ncbi:uncharacterized protein [Apostichopus japonicus]|uniref:uncharacterized protein isoform X3 n=1 Tax=Stichopus japonicus TaxID=307972 RepID=UPI003AB162EB
MTSKISQEEYQKLMKALHARRISTAKPNTTMANVHDSSSSGRTVDLTGHQDRHQYKLPLLHDDGDDSDSGYTNSISQPPSSSNLMSSGTSVESTTNTAAVYANKDALSPSIEPVNQSEKDAAMTTTASSDMPQEKVHPVGLSSRNKEGSSDTCSEATRLEPVESDIVYTTPSKLLQKIDNREIVNSTSGVGSFQSFTSPSVLIKSGLSDSENCLRLVHQNQETRDMTEQPEGVREAIEQPGGVREAIEQPGGVRETIEQPDGLREAIEQPQGVREAIEQPGGVRETIEQPGGVRETIEQPGGVGSFESFTVPSQLLLMMQDDADTQNALPSGEVTESNLEERQMTEQGKGSVGSSNSFTAPSKLLLMTQSDITAANSELLPSSQLHGEKRCDNAQNHRLSSGHIATPLPRKGQLAKMMQADVEFGTVSSEEDDDNSTIGGATAYPESSAVDKLEKQSPDAAFFEYSTPSYLLLRKEQRLRAEATGGVGSFQSFTTPSELFMGKESLCFPSAMDRVDSITSAHPEVCPFKSSTEQFHLDSAPSELLKLKTELIISERIASAKSLHRQSQSHAIGEEDYIREEQGLPSEEVEGKSPSEGIGDSSDISMDDIEVNISGADATHHEEQHVNFADDAVLAKESEETLPESSGSDISLIMEESSDDGPPEYSSNFDVEDVELPGQSVGRSDRRAVAKARSYPLMHLQNVTLCCGNDLIQCECSDRESVEKLVGHDFIEEEEPEETISNESTESKSLGNSHSWADATWRSLEMVLEGQNEMENKDDEWEPKPKGTVTLKDDTDEQSLELEPKPKGTVTLKEDTEEQSLELVGESYGKLKQLIAEKDWLLMEAKLEQSQLLLRNRREMDEERVQFMKRHHRIADELIERNQGAENKIREQGEEIRFLREEVRTTSLTYEGQLTAMREDHLNLYKVHKSNLQTMKSLQDQVQSLSVELDASKTECCNLMEATLSEKENKLSTEITDPEPLDKTNTAYAKIFVELDEEQKKFSIETEVDRAFICGDGSKTDEELHDITEDLTLFIREELLLNVIPALFPASSPDDSPGDITTSRQPPSQEGGGTASAAMVTITLGDQEDTKVRIQAEMDAGFLGEGRTDEEVEHITHQIAKYVQDHFLEEILQRLFPGDDVKSKFAISCDVCSSSLHNVISAGIKNPSDGAVESQSRESTDRINQLSAAIEELNSKMNDARAEINALQGIIRRQEVEKKELSERYERKGEQLKDVCCQFTESERRWTEDREVMEKRLEETKSEMDEMRANMEMSEIDGIQQEEEIRALNQSVSILRKELQESETELTEEEKRRDRLEKEAVDMRGEIRRLKDDRGEVEKRLDEKQKELENLSLESEKRLDEKQKELENLSLESEKSRTAVEERLRSYEGALNEKDVELKVLEESKQQVERLRSLERVVSSLRNENHHLKTSLEALTPPYDISTSSHTDDIHTIREKVRDFIPIPWEKYRTMLTDNHGLATRVGQLEKEKEDHLKRGRALNEELRGFQAEMCDLKTCIADLTGDLREALLESKSLEHKVETGELRAEFKLQAQIMEAEKTKEGKRKVMMRRLENLEDEKVQLEAERDGLVLELTKLGGEKSELEVQLSESKEKLSRCQEDLQNAKDQLHIKQAQLSTASGLLEELKYEKGGMSTKILDLYQELLRTQTDVERAKDSKREDVVHLQSRISSLEKDLLCNEKDLKQVQSKLSKAKSEMAEKEILYAVKEESIQQLRKERDEAHSKIAALEQTLKQRETETLMITEAHRQKEEELGRVTSRLAVLTSEAELAKRELSEQTQEMKEKTQTVQSLENELHNTTTEILEEKRKKEELDWELNEEREEHLKLQEDHKQLENDHILLEKELKNIQEERDEGKKSYSLLQQQYQMLHDNHTRLDCTSESQRNFNSFLQKELEKTTGTVDRLKDTAMQLQTELNRNQKMLEEKGEVFDRSISESQGEISRLGSLLSESLESQKTVEQSNKDQAEQLAEEEEKVLSLTSDLEQLQKEFVEERKSVKKLRAEKDKLRKQLDDKIEKLSNEKNTLQNRLYEEEVAARVSHFEQDNLSKQLMGLRKFVEKEMADGSPASQKTEALEKEVQKLQEKNSELNQNIDSMEDSCVLLMKELEEKKTEMADLSSRLSLAEHQTTAYRRKIDDLEVALHKERNLSESLKKVSKEKKKRWLLSNQLFSSKIKTQLETSDEKVSELQDELGRMSHENQLQSGEISEKSHIIHSLRERNSSLEEFHSSLTEELQRTKRQLDTERELVQSLSTSLLKNKENEKSNLVRQHSIFGSRIQDLMNPYSVDAEAEEVKRKNEMKALEMEMKKNLQDEIRDHVKTMTSKFTTPKKTDLTFNSG